MRPMTILWIFSAAKNVTYRSPGQQLRAKYSVQLPEEKEISSSSPG